MGMDLSLDTRPEVHVEHNWTMTDGRALIDVLFLSVGLLEQHLQVDLTPLKKLGGQELASEDWAEIAEMTGRSEEELLKEAEDQNNGAWQTPDDLATCLRSLIQVLDNHRHTLPLTELKSNQPTCDSYFENGNFLSDLKDLLRWTDEAKKSGAKEVRIFIV